MTDNREACVLGRGKPKRRECTIKSGGMVMRHYGVRRVAQVEEASAEVMHEWKRTRHEAHAADYPSRQ